MTSNILLQMYICNNYIRNSIIWNKYTRANLKEDWVISGVWGRSWKTNIRLIYPEAPEEFVQQISVCSFIDGLKY